MLQSLTSYSSAISNTFQVQAIEASDFGTACKHFWDIKLRLIEEEEGAI